jgi:murein DD-endopeptidase MepM/ murein hydrolase activator NlpD
MMKFNLVFVFTLCLGSASLLADIYKYKDASGKWSYSDKKPEQMASANVQKIEYAKTEKKSTRPSLEIEADGKYLIYKARNPFHAVIQCFLQFDDIGVKRVTEMLYADSTKILYKSKPNEKKRAFDFWCVIGDPKKKPVTTLVLPPFLDFKPMRISQGFNGRFSHHSQPSLYAVDIGMPVSTKIVAVKKGVVISTKDDYAVAGVSSPFFFDKANYIDIMHDDGTYAIYAHLLLGGVKVKKGQMVEAGQVIGLSGNTGYSTGPHLHFAIRHNSNGRTKSIPFKFSQPNKNPIEPKRGVWLLPDTDSLVN